MKTYRFYKEWDLISGNSNWFIDLKYFPFNKGYLAMVAGADELLDKLSKGKEEVNLLISTKPFPYTDGWLQKEVGLGLRGGAIYNAKGIEISNTFNTQEFIKSQLWLCPVTLLIFWKYPEKIYYKIDNTKLESKERVKNPNPLFGEGNLSGIGLRLT